MRGRRGGTPAAYGAEHTVKRREEVEESVRAGSRRLWPYLRRHYRAYLIGALMLVATNLLMVWIPKLLSRMVELLDKDPIDLSLLLRLLLMVLAAAFAGGLARVANRLLIFNTGREIEYELRKALFGHMQRMHSRVFARRPVGDLVSRATNDLSSVRLLFGFGLLHLMNTPILFVMAIVVMVSLNARLTAAVLAIYPIVIFCVRGYSRRMFDLTQQVQGTLGDISAASQENFSAIQVVKSYTLEEHETEKMRRMSQGYLAKSVKLALTRNVLFNIMTSVIGLSELVLLAYGGWEIVNGRLTKGELVAFSVYLGMLTWPTMAFGFLLSVWQRGMGAMSRIEEILAEPTEPEGLIKVRGDPWGASDFWKQDIEICGLTWGYPQVAAAADGRQMPETLRDVTMQIEGGRFTALVGPTGCGKTTLARLIARLDNPPPGTVSIGGADMTAIPLADLRNNVGLATQESFLFSMSLAENIRFGRPDAEFAKVERAAEQAELARDLEEFPRGYDTPVGERGITLSGGQRQRAAIARVLVYDPPVLILDDSLSAVDLKTEEKVLAHLRERLAGRTVLLITHRIATASEADHVYVMDQGSIVEHGTHEELLESGGLYARLAEIQKLKDDLEAA
jgi:ATP-binding cassette subfamily B multidrug efflux pump